MGSQGIGYDSTQANGRVLDPPYNGIRVDSYFRKAKGLRSE